MSSQLSDQARWFAEEVKPHERALRSYLSQSLPTAADVDDLVQDSYARILRARNNGMIRRVKPFLFSIARNRVRDFLRQEAKADLFPITETVALPVLEDEGGLVERVCNSEELALLADAIRTLPQRCREVILLRKIKGLSQKEIAELLGITENTVESLATKGVHRCGEYLRTRGVNGSS